MNEPPTPTPRELEIFKILWERGPSSVRDVHRLLVQGEDLAYNTIQTLMRIMEDKGLVGHKTEGRDVGLYALSAVTKSAWRFLDWVFRCCC